MILGWWWRSRQGKRSRIVRPYWPRRRACSLSRRTNPDNALTLLVISSQLGSCASGQGFPPLYWEVGCGLVGVNEYDVDRFTLFPNPTNGDLYVRLADGIAGKVRMDVMDITGRLVISEQFNATTGQTERFDLSALVNGNYAVRLSTDNWSKTEMLQVAR